MNKPLSETEFNLFRHLINKHIGISLSDSKKIRLQRKLASRLNLLGLKSYNAYYRYLLHNESGGSELRQLINTVTVDLTSFFRHPKQFELLSKVVLPQVAAQKKGIKKLRIWSAGCARGQEAYSIAMVVSEILEKEGIWDAKILASDIDTDALKFAYKGKYPRESVQGIPPEYLDKYFERGTGRDSGFYLVREALRKKLLFRRLNLGRFDFAIKSHIDIIFCRNVTIYFGAEVKKTLIDYFFNTLERDGFLFMGSSESLFGIDDRFALVGHSIYQKKG